MMRRGAGAGQVWPAPLRPKGARGSPAWRPAGGGRRCPAAGSLHPSAPDGEETRAAGDPPHGRGQPEEAASRRPGTVTAPLRPQGPRPEVTRWAGRGPPPRSGCGGGERSPGPAPSHKGEARNSARTGRRTRRVGGSVFPRGGSAGVAAVTAGRGRGLCPGILPKKAAGLFFSFPSERARQPRPGCSAGWRRAAPQDWALRPSSRRATSAQPGRGAGRSPDPAAPQPLSAAA